MGYSFAFVAALTGLLCWNLFAKRKAGTLFQVIFFAGLLTWAFMLYSSALSLNEKMFVTMRDLLVLGFGGLIMSSAKTNFIAGLLTLAGAFVFLQVSYLDILRNTFKDIKVGVAPEAELLVDVHVGKVVALKELLTKNGASLTRAFYPSSPDITSLDELYLIDLEGDASAREIDRVREILHENKMTDWIEVNETVRIEPLSGSESSLKSKNKFVNDPLADKQWALEALGIAELHATLSSTPTLSAKKALIAIVDTGVDGNHEDLKDRFRSKNAIYDRDGTGHGTHVAGIAGAMSNNGVGVASFAPGGSLVEITSIKVLSDLGFGTQATIIKGMVEAADMGAEVISMSLGGRSSDKKENAYKAAVEYCNKKGAIVVVAAGNANTDARKITPANVEGVITVAALDRNLRRASFSNWVDDIDMAVSAPGDGIYSTYPNNSYKELRGTSMATPHVSGLIGILKSLKPDLNTREAFEILIETGRTPAQGEKAGTMIDPTKAVSSLIK